MMEASVVRVVGSVRKGKATVMATTSVRDPSSVAWTTAIDQSKILGLPTMTAVMLWFQKGGFVMPTTSVREISYVQKDTTFLMM